MCTCRTEKRGEELASICTQNHKVHERIYNNDLIIRKLTALYGKGGDGFFLWKGWRWFLLMERAVMVSSYGKGSDGFFLWKGQ